MKSTRHALVMAVFLFLPVAAAAQGATPSPQPVPEQSSSQPSASGESASQQARALAEMLKDDKARALLIQRLEEVAADTGTGDTAPQDTITTLEIGLVEAIAQRSADIAGRLARFVNATTKVIVDLGSEFTGEGDALVQRTVDLVKDVAVLVAVTFGLFFVLRSLARALHVRLARRAGQAAWLHKSLLLCASVLLDGVVAAGAWAGGYGFALAFSDADTIDISKTLFLNAFLAIEVIKTGVRAVLEPRRTGLRMLPMGDETAVYWAFWAGRLVSLLGYGLLMVAPIVAARVSQAAGTALGLLVALTAVVMAVVIVLQNRAAVRDALLARATRQPGRLESGLLRALARTWHLGAMLYVVVLFGLWVVRPDDGPRWMLWATLQSGVAIGLGALVSGFIARWVSGGIRLPEDVRERLPLLEKRLNAYVPAILGVVRLVVLVAVTATIAHIWGVVDFLNWLKDESGRETLLRVFSAFLIAVVALAIYLGVASWVEYRLNPNFGAVPTARERTLLSLFRNAFSVALAIIASMLVLAQLGVNIGPLLAGAGVLGLAIGFGAQKLVQDMITGAFIQLENAMNEGDVVTVAGITGVVERLTIRSVGLRDLTGVYHVIPFSSADSVSNFMKDFSYHVAEIGVAYRENVAEVKELMQEAFDRLREGEHGKNLIADLDMHGLTEFGDSAVVVRARLKCLPGTQWAAGRAYNEIIKEIFDERGVEIPFPHVTLYMGEDKEGHAPPLRIVGGSGDDGPEGGGAPARDDGEPAADGDPDRGEPAPAKA